MFCSHCGAQLAAGVKYCTSCGSAVEAPAAPAVAQTAGPVPVAAPSSAPPQNASAQPVAASTGTPSKTARIAIIVAAMVLVAVVAGAIGRNAGRVSGGDSSLPSSSSANADSPESSASTSSDVAASNVSPAAMTPSPSGRLMEYKADNGGFGITIDDTFAVKDTADQFIVYTAKEGVLPQYQIIWSRTSSGGMTDEEILETMMDIAVKNYGDLIIAGPVTNSFQLSDGRTIRGIEFIFETDGSGQLAKYEYYEDQVNGFTYTWSGTCNPDDSVTPKAMEVAMDSFHFLAS